VKKKIIKKNSDSSGQGARGKGARWERARRNTDRGEGVYVEILVHYRHIKKQEWGEGRERKRKERGTSDGKGYHKKGFSNIGTYWGRPELCFEKKEVGGDEQGRDRGKSPP